MRQKKFCPKVLDAHLDVCSKNAKNEGEINACYGSFCKDLLLTSTTTNATRASALFFLNSVFSL